MSGLVIKQDQNLSKLFEEVTEYEVKKALNKIGDVVVDEMKARIAVDTGNAQKSIKKYLKRYDNGWGVTVYPSTRYYYYQEIGTSRFKGNVGRLLSAIVDTRAECFDIAEEVLKRK